MSISKQEQIKADLTKLYELLENAEAVAKDLEASGAELEFENEFQELFHQIAGADLAADDIISDATPLRHKLIGGASV